MAWLSVDLRIWETEESGRILKILPRLLGILVPLAKMEHVAKKNNLITNLKCLWDISEKLHRRDWYM